MNEEKAKKILKDFKFEDIYFVCDSPHFSCGYEDNYATLDGYFSTEELEAIAWVMKKKKPQKVRGFTAI